MLAPDGTSGEVPQANVQAALAKGFKQAVAMTSPDGKQGYIPLGRAQDALAAGFNIDTSHVAGAGPGGPPQLAAHPQSPAMQSSLLAPSTYGKAISDTVSGLAAPLAHPVNQVLSYNPVGAINNAAHSGPIQSIVDNPDKGAGVANALTQVGTGLALGKAFDVAPKVVNALSDATTSARQFIRPTSSPSIVSPEEVQAQKIAQSILPPGGIKPELVKSIQQEAPAVVEYAQRTGNPLNTQAEGLKAAQGVAQEGLEHYKTEVLAPVANRSVVLDPTSTELGDKATIGDIDSRISYLNKLINTAKATSAGDAAAIRARSQWDDEVSYLRGKLYSSLEHTTGIPQEDLQNLREGYGGEFSLANQLEAAQNARLTRVGEQAQGKTSINIRRPSILEAPGMAYNALKGGEQAIADRQFSAAIKDVQPQAPVRPTPPPIDTDALATQQAQAQLEFLRQHQLEQAAQDATAGRDQRVAGYRDAQAATQQAQAQLEGEAARTVGRGNVQQAWANQGASRLSAHLSNDSSSGLTQADIGSLANTPQGKSLLVRASSMTPGSTMMKNLIQQIKTLVR
jgi:hypothetical protein